MLIQRQLDEFSNTNLTTLPTLDGCSRGSIFTKQESHVVSLGQEESRNDPEPYGACLFSYEPTSSHMAYGPISNQIHWSSSFPETTGRAQGYVFPREVPFQISDGASAGRTLRSQPAPSSNAPRNQIRCKEPLLQLLLIPRAQ